MTLSETESMADLSNLSPSEYEKISGVLKRDRELRSLEEARIRQLKQELICLRKRAALKPGFDPLRNCARCLTELGRILNRGALCPVCLKKVCKDCRHYGDRNHEWLCIYCYKQMQLKAISGEWMLEFSRLSSQNRAKDSPGDQLRKVLHDTQRRGMLSNDVTETAFPLLPVDPPPEKPPRIFTYEPPCQNAASDDHLQPVESKIDSTDSSIEKISPEPQRDVPQSSPKLLPRISPWSDIDPEPTLPARIDKSRALGGMQQFETISFKERQSSDEGHCTAGYRSRSVSSEVMDESEPHVPVPLPRKRINPLKKQQAIPDPNPVDNQQSSVETTDSGVCSPVLKTDFSLDTNPPASPLAVSRLSSNEQESIDSPTFAQCLASESSLSETDDDRRPQTKISGNFFRKRKSAHTRSADSKFSAKSADCHLMPALGLSHSFTHYNVYSNPLSNTNFKQKLIGSYLNFSNFLRSDSCAGACCKQTKHILTRSIFHLNSRACALHSNLEALGTGDKNPQLYETAARPQQSSDEQNGFKSKRRDRRKKYFLQFPHLRRKRGRKRDCSFNSTQQKTEDSLNNSKSSTDSNLQSNKNLNSLDAHVEHESYCPETSYPNKSEKSRNNLVRSASLPSYKTFSEDWLKPWLWKCHSLEDWLWYLEEQPYQSRNFSEIANMLPDDYKLVYVSSSSSDSDECATVFDLLADCQTKLNSKTHLKVNSHIKINYGTSYIEDSDWELESEDSGESDSTAYYKTRNKINEANNFLINYVSHADHNYTRDINGSQRDNLALDLIRTPELHHSFQSYIPVINSPNFPVTDLHFLSNKHKYFHDYAVLKKVQSNMNIQSCTSHPGYEERKIVESLEKLSTLISEENIPSWPRFNSERPSSLLLSALCSSFESNDGEKPDFVLDHPQYFRTNLQKQLTHHSDLFMSSPADDTLFSQSFQHISKPNFEIFFEQQITLHCAEFHILLNVISQILTTFANNFNFMSLRSFSADNILFPRHLIRLNKLFPLLDVNIKQDSVLTPCNEINFSPFLFKIIAVRDTYFIICSLQDCTKNYMKSIKRNRSSDACVHPYTSINTLSELLNVFKESPKSRTTPRDMFDSVSWWRDCCEEKVGNWLQLDDANAFHYTSFPLSSYATNRGNDNSATGWGKLRCCIAVATQRVIDLNPRALVCGREVLDSADLTSYLRWEAGTDDKLGKSANLVNAFLYRNPPVFQKPEADYLFCLTRSKLCVLFQRSLHARVEIRMIAAKFGVTGVPAFDKTDHDSSLSSNKTEKKCEEMQSESTETFASNGNHQLALDSSWINTNEDVFQIHCHSRKSDSGSCKNVNKQEASFLRWNALDSVDYDKCAITEQTGENTASVSDASCCKFYLHTRENIKELLQSDFSSECPVTEILPCVENAVDTELSEEYRNCEHNPMNVLSAVSDNSDSNERIDCQCNKPCEVPSSPSVVDATVERSITDDGEIFSSGDELDKFESDTDSQDTVIEGEAYKRIRSVAIKEKILHANEELFGSNSKETFFNSHSPIAFSCNPVINRNENSKPQVKMCSLDEIQSKKSPASFLQTQYHSDIPELPIFSDSEESDSPTVFSSLEKHLLSFKKQNLSAFHSALPFSEQKSDDSCIRTEMHSLSSYCNSFNETTCSSESSDNGSDGEEVILSDTSTSSDEATYIAPSSGFQYYSHPVSYKLHTIAEESCEESERSSKNSIPLSKSCSEFEYYDKTRLSLVKNPRKCHRKLMPDNPILAANTEFKNGKGSAVYAVLATSRLEKYFKSSLQDGDKVSYPDDDMTDESGEVSSEEDLASDRLINQMIVGKRIENLYKSPKVPSSSDWYLPSGKSNRLGSPNSLKSSSSECKTYRQTEMRKDFDFGLPAMKPGQHVSELKQNKVSDQVSDDEAKYIMNHLMQHITNNSDVKQESNSEIKDMSPMLKILESEIARLMLTVSPASLSTGEPSSSCSSTIGSNNSDYGSDTLESAEESTSEEELSADIAPENRPVRDVPEQIDSVSASAPNEALASDDVQSANFAPSCGDPVVSEETLYICKQLMASLKKIADSTEGAYGSDEICAGTEDHTAKQYITDQIVSLMQTVNASHNNSPLLRRLSSNPSAIQIDSDISQDRSDSDSPPPNDDKREHSKSKTPSESGSETTISASISIPSYDDSDRTPTESEISHEMDELYALLESSSASQDMINSAKFSYDLDNHSLDKSVTSRNADSPLSEDDINFAFSESSEVNLNSSESESSLLYGAASKLESLLPITIEERIARYKDAFLNKVVDSKDLEGKAPEMRINVILPQPSISENIVEDTPMNSTSLPSNFEPIFNSKSGEKLSAVKSCDDILSTCCIHKVKSDETSYNITSVKIISHNTYPPSSAIHKILSNNIDSTYLDQKHDYNVVNICDVSSCKAATSNEIFMSDNTSTSGGSANQCAGDNESTILSPLPKVINPKEKASSENDLLVANYRTKYKGNKVFGTKSVGNICELENISNKSTFRDTGYYSFKSSEESFLSLDDSTASQTSTASLTQYRSLTSTETIPEEEESCAKGTASTKMSLSSSNIPDAVCDNSPSKSSTLPLSLRNKLSSTSNANHRTRSSFFSTSGVLRKLTLLRDESGNSLRFPPHNRYNPRRNRSSSGGSDDGKQKKTTPHKHESLEQSGRLSAASSEKDSSEVQDEDIDQHLSFTTRSQMSLSSFGGRSESVTSVYSAAGGRRYGTVIVTGDVLFGLNYNYKVGVLEVNIKECRNLAAVDTKKNRSDPYVKVYLLPDRTKSGKRKTKVKKHTLNPVFDELLKFQVTVSELEIRTLWLSVWHSDRFGRNDFLGEIMLPLGNDTFENSGLKWYPLQERLETLDPAVSYKGDLILALKYVPPDVTSRRFSKKPGIPAKGALEVLVREARNLMATRSNGTSDPFCKSYLLPDKSKAGKQKTPVFKKSCNPKWNHTFVYDDVSLDDLRERCLELTIWDYDKITSNDFLGGVRLCLGTGKYQGREVDWMDSIGEERSLWYTMLDRPNTWVDGSLLLRSNMQSRRIV